MIEASIEQLSELYGIIYGILNLKNNRWYIGQTYLSFRKRYPKLEWWARATAPLKSAYRKYGIDSFKVFIFEHGIIDRNELDSLERNYIKEYNSLYPNGYNFESGGHASKIIHEVSKSKLSKSLLKNKAKEYEIYDKNKNLHKFSNIITFAKENGLDERFLSNLLRGKVKRYEGWHTDIDVILDKPFKNSELRTLIGPDGIEYKFYNATEFAKKNNLTPDGVACLMTGKILYHRGFHLPNARKRKKSGWGNKNNPQKKFEQIILEKNGELYTINDDIDDFCEKYKIKKWDIYALTTGNQLTAKGFKIVSVKYTEKFLKKNLIQEIFSDKNISENIVNEHSPSI